MLERVLPDSRQSGCAFRQGHINLYPARVVHLALQVVNGQRAVHARDGNASGESLLRVVPKDLQPLSDDALFLHVPDNV